MLWLYSVVLSASDADDIRAVLDKLNTAVQTGDVEAIRRFLAPNINFRDGSETRIGVDAVVTYLQRGETWTERTRPIVEVDAIHTSNGAVAFVDAHWVRYGSTTIKTSTPVVLLLEKSSPQWRILVWRSMPECATMDSP